MINACLRNVYPACGSCGMILGLDLYSGVLNTPYFPNPGLPFPTGGDNDHATMLAWTPFELDVHLPLLYPYC